jgi:hypothetical protein
MQRTLWRRDIGGEKGGRGGRGEAKGVFGVFGVFGALGVHWVVSFGSTLDIDVWLCAFF